MFTVNILCLAGLGKSGRGEPKFFLLLEGLGNTGISIPHPAFFLHPFRISYTFAFLWPSEQNIVFDQSVHREHPGRKLWAQKKRRTSSMVLRQCSRHPFHPVQVLKIHRAGENFRVLFAETEIVPASACHNQVVDKPYFHQLACFRKPPG